MSDLWKNEKWVVFGDSLTDVSTQYKPYRKYAQVIAESTAISIVTQNGGVNMGVGGTGYCKTHDANPPKSFYDRSVYVPSDASIITVFGSVNDWSGPSCRNYDNSGTTGKYPSVSDAYKYTITEKAGQSGYITASTLTGYINDTIRRFHRVAPNAKIVMIPGLYYMLATRYSAGYTLQQWELRAYVLQRIVFESWYSQNIDGCRNWLKYESWFLDVDPYSPPSTVSAARCINDTTHLDFTNIVPSNYGSTFDSRKFNPAYYGDDDFASAYLRDWNASVYYSESGEYSGGHPSEAYYVNYLAPKFANLLCEVLGTSAAELPSNLRLNHGVAPSASHTATFVADGRVIDTVEFEAGASVLPRVPAVPAKVGYTGAWEPYTLSDADITINAVYAANTYHVTFKADGVTVAVVPYQYGVQSITEPPVPPKDGYTGTWSAYTLGAQDSVSQAVYTPIEWVSTNEYVNKSGEPIMSAMTSSGDTVYELVDANSTVHQLRRQSP